jgi:hypothetical protein
MLGHREGFVTAGIAVDPSACRWYMRVCKNRVARCGIAPMRVAFSAIRATDVRSCENAMACFSTLMIDPGIFHEQSQRRARNAYCQY